MARINPELLARLQKRLGVGQQQTYKLIADKAGEARLPRHLAALALAADQGININKRAYASDEDRAILRGVPGAATVNPDRATRPKAASNPRAGGNVRARAAAQRKSNRVLVVHGRDLKVRDAVFEFLRALSLQPIEWAAAVRATKKGTPYVGEVLNTMFRQAAGVVVLLTPDDEARLKRAFLKPADPPYERNLTGQARPNVLFEAGRAFGSHPDSTIMVQVGEVRPFSDTLGTHLVHLADTAECRQDLANRLEGAGCAVNRDGTDRLSAGDFAAVTPSSGRRSRPTRS